MGWRCHALGVPRVVSGIRLGAFRVDIDGKTPALLAARGIYHPSAFALPAQHAA
jgi:sRNA-binding protein